ncbi:MAG: response regulator [Pseudomonadota bacterium]|nr:response regulator [Pseudomonadota bacterium]
MSAPSSSPDPSSARRVLLVDDNVDAVESMEILLQAFGYEVATAIHPDLALAQLESFAPAAAVIDIGLPGMDGYQLAAEIRRRLAGRPLRLIAFTGYGGADDVAKAIAAGFDAHLVKPVEIDRLLALLAG